jgi:hypothetical protein
MTAIHLRAADSEAVGTAASTVLGIKVRLCTSTAAAAA